MKMLNERSKVEVMDLYLESYGKEITGPEIRRAINEVFGIDLDLISAAGEGTQPSSYAIELKEAVANQLGLDQDSTKFKELLLSMKKVDVMDTYLKYCDKNIKGAKIRRIVNQIFGVNLDGISSIEHAGISIFSKGGWILHKDSDLFVVYTTKGDAEIKVCPTSFFAKKTGLNQLPDELQQSLINLGFSSDEKTGEYSYADPNGQSVPEMIKGKVFESVLMVIRNSNL